MGNGLSHGVMVAHQILVLLAQVRILVGQQNATEWIRLHFSFLMHNGLLSSILIGIPSPPNRPRVDSPAACLQACELVEQTKADVSPTQTRPEPI